MNPFTLLAITVAAQAIVRGAETRAADGLSQSDLHIIKAEVSLWALRTRLSSLSPEFSRAEYYHPSVPLSSVSEFLDRCHGERSILGIMFESSVPNGFRDKISISALFDADNPSTS